MDSSTERLSSADPPKTESEPTAPTTEAVASPSDVTPFQTWTSFSDAAKAAGDAISQAASATAQFLEPYMTAASDAFTAAEVVASDAASNAMETLGWTDHNTTSDASKDDSDEKKDDDSSIKKTEDDISSSNKDKDDDSSSGTEAKPKDD